MQGALSLGPTLSEGLHTQDEGGCGCGDTGTAQRGLCRAGEGGGIGPCEQERVADSMSSPEAAEAHADSQEGDTRAWGQEPLPLLGKRPPPL